MVKDIWCHSTTDVSYFRPYAETKNNGSDREVFMKWIQFRSWFRPRDAKVSSFIMQKLFRCFSLSFNLLVDVVWMFLSCSIIMIFPWMLKSWSCLLKGIYIWFYEKYMVLNADKCYFLTLNFNEHAQIFISTILQLKLLQKKRFLDTNWY